jgi:ABC-type amino acid transport substrate-binding protein
LVVGVDVDGAREIDAELGVELVPPKELEYVFEQRPCT